jgi:hypothetical protein
MPSQPDAPTTTVDGNNVVIDWNAPNDNGSPIRGYIIYIRQSDNSTFSVSTTDCNGALLSIRTETKCSVPISTLRGTQYELTWGSIVYAKVLAYNDYDSSQVSTVGGSAKILTVPNAPIAVSELYSSRTATSLGLQWSIAGYGVTKDGGSPVINYQVTYTTGSTTIVVPNIADTKYTANNLVNGANYVFFVQAKNSFDLSLNSQLTYMYCSFVPATPVAPTTSVSLNKVIIKWDAPNNNGALIDSYSVQIK